MSVQARFDFSQVFPEEKVHAYEYYLNGISKKTLIEFSVMLIAVSNPDSVWQDIHSLVFGKWFRKENYKFANYVYDKFQHVVNENKQEGHNTNFILLNKIGALRFLEIVLSAQELPKIDETDPLIIEQNILKLILIINEEDNKKDDTATTSIENYSNIDPIILLYITYGIGQYELINTNRERLLALLITQLIKALYLFEFLETYNTNLLNIFLNKYNTNNFQSYVNKFMPLAMAVLSNLDEENSRNEPKHTTIRVGNNEDDLNFLEKFIISNNRIDEDVDFKLLRESPLAKIDDNNFLIINDLFVVQKIFNGLYFELKDLNSKLTQDKIKDFRSFFTFTFTEKYLFYKTINNIYGHRGYVQKSGDLMYSEYGLEGAPDYYIRNGKIIFLFENKDIFISSNTKSSYDFSIIKNEIDKKLVIEAGIPQVISNIKRALTVKFKFDQNYDSNKCIIYPMIITHRSELDTPGINKYLQTHFVKQLDQLALEGFNINNIKNLTLINIDTLLLYQYPLANKRIKLDDAIDAYHLYVNEKNIKAHTPEEYRSILTNKLNSFSDFIALYSSKRKIHLIDEIKRWANTYFKKVLFN